MNGSWIPSCKLQRERERMRENKTLPNSLVSLIRISVRGIPGPRQETINADASSLKKALE